MNRKTLKYVGFYDFSDSRNRGRNCCLAATNKMDYVCSAIVRAGYNVQIISPSWIGERGNGKYEKQQTVKVDDDISVTFCPSWRTSNKIAGYIKIIFSLNWLFLYLLFKARKNEKILVYHTSWLSIPIRMVNLFKRFKLVLEVEEIYGKVWKNKKLLNMMENGLIPSADYYILVSDLLAKILGISQSIILYGGYVYIDKKANDTNKNGHINIVYAGSIDTTRNAAFNIVETVKYLNNNYIVNILGFGGEEQIQKLKQQILDMNNTLKREACLYHGIKPEREFTKFLHSCQIGVNSQMVGDYFNTAFPSKILTYLSHNLIVVSTPIKSVVESALSDMINFADSDSPEDIAKAIMAVDINHPYDSMARIKELDEKFVDDIGKLLKG